MKRLQLVAFTAALLGLMSIGCGNKSSTAAKPAANAGANPPGATAPPPTSTAAYPPLPSSTAPTASASNQQPAPPPQPVAAPAQPAAAPAQPPPPQAPPPVPAITIPAGTQVAVRMIDAIDSAHNTAGQIFRATLSAPITLRGAVVAPAGTPVSVLLANSRSAGRIHGRSELEVRLSRIEARGRSYPVDSSIYEETGKARGQQTAVRTGIGAAAGAIIGALAGGGKGAAIGSAAGGGAGFGVNALTHGQQVRIPSESVLTFRLRRRLTIPG